MKLIKACKTIQVIIEKILILQDLVFNKIQGTETNNLNVMGDRK